MTQHTVLITGATGFVGRALALAMRARGDRVFALVRRDDAILSEAGVALLHGELGPEISDSLKSLPAIDACFHVAAKVEMWGKREDFVRVNIDGTRSLLHFCKLRGVRNFIYTSSPSVIANGSDLRGIDESVPYPKHFEALYPETKAVAERLVLEAHQPGVFNTVSLRPHLIFGPGDTNLIPTIVERARAGRLKLIGDGKNLSDFTFIEDCVRAHLNAWDAMQKDDRVGGRAYFISQGTPYPLWKFVSRVLEAHKIPQLTQQVPYLLARSIACVCESVAKLWRGTREPLLTRFLVSEMATDHYFSIKAAEEKLGFVPRYSVEEALERTLGILNKEAQGAA